MTKRILAMLLAVALVCSFMPNVVLAEGEGTPAAHDNSAHKCEHCDTTVTWTAWGDDAAEKTKLPTSGHYYLVEDIDLQAQTAVGSGELVLCLNGHDVVASKNVHMFRIATTGKVTITDCTAKTEAGVYDAGKLTPYSGGGYVAMIVDNTEARFNLYDGIITGANTNSGCVANMKGNAIFAMYGGEISGNAGGSGIIYMGGASDFVMEGGTIQNNTATNGMIYAYGSGNHVTINGGTLRDNTAKTSGGVIYARSTSPVTIKNATITGNKANGTTDTSGTTAGNGGGVVHSGGGTVTIENCTITGNTAAMRAGVVYGVNSTVNIKNTEISGNKAASSGAIEMFNGTLTLENTRVINNNTTGSYGAIHFWNNGGTASVVLKGETVITDNIFGDAATSTAQRNLYVRDHWNYINVDALSAQANVGLFVETNRINATNGKQYLSTSATTESIAACFTSDKQGYYSGLSATGRLILTNVPPAPPEPEHPHKLCNDSACTDHGDLEFTKWTDANSLPAAGNYFLDTDVTLTAEVAMNTGDVLNLCLNGHNITMDAKGTSKSVFNMKGDAKLSITDCQADPGKITGATNAAIFGNNNSTVEINLYNGIFTGNTGNYAGAAFLQGNAVFNMYGGALTGNTHAAKLKLDANGDPVLNANGDQTYSGATGGGAICLYYGNATFNLYDGTIRENTSTAVTYLAAGKETKAGGNAGAIYAEGTNTRINILGGKITKNTADADGGAIYIKKGQATLKAGVISENKAANGGAVYITDPEAVLTICGSEITGNSANNGGAVMAVSRSNTKLESGKLSNNTATSGAGLYISRNTPFAMSGGEISGNTSTGSGAGIYLLENTASFTGGTISGNASDYNGGAIFSNAAVLQLAGVQILDNQAKGGAGIYANAATTLTLSGDTRITGNTADGKQNNLYLPGTTTVQLGQLGENATIGISAATAFRAISQESDTDYSSKFTSDKPSLQIQYQDKKLFLGANGNHTHCLCAAAIEKGCDHSEVLFASWDDPNSLPSNGNWFLNTDVTVTSAVDMRDVTLNLCLNGHTITMQTEDKRQIFDVKGAANLNITDCAEAPGTITGATNAVIYGNNNATGTVNLYNGILTGNSGAMAGAVVLQTDMVFNMYGGKITENSHTVAVDANGKVTGSFGAGAITAYYGNTQFNMYGGEISNNKSAAVTYQDGETTARAGGNAGAIYGEGNAVQINLYGGTLSGNHADNAGGAVYVWKGTVNLKGTKLEGNTAGNKAGAVFVTGNGNLILDGSELIGNSAANGGAILIESQTHMDFISGKISGNTANDGGGIYITTNTFFKMSGGEISGNTATGNGGGVALLCCEAVIADGIITENTAKYGGGILVRGCELQLQGGKITKNTATSNGGGIKTGNQVSGDKTLTAKITMTGGLVSENKANAGGGIIVEGAGCDMVLKAGEISKNTATNGGGMFISTKTTFTMEGGKVSGNSAKTGGGIQLLKSTATFKGGEISGNNCTSTGGGVYVTNEPAMATFKGTTIKNNKGGYGGGFCVANRAKAVIESGSISGNTAVNNGGGAYISTNSFLDMYSGTISGNRAEKDTGGGLYGLRSTMNLYGGTISNNTSMVGGGGIMVAAATLNLKGADVVNNSAVSANGKGGTGGGVRTNCQTVTKDGVKTQYYAKIVMTAGTISGNTCGYGGGGVLLNGVGASMEMSGGTISDNTSNDLGGGLYVSNKTTFTMTGGEVCRNETKNDGGGFWLAKNTTHSIANAKIYENTAGKRAGAVYFHNNATCTFTDVEFTKNVANNGGAIFGQQDMNPIMIRCTFTENEAIELSGGAIFSRYMATIEDCKFIGNKSGGNGGAVYVGHSSLSVNGFGSSTRDDAGVFITNTTFENNTAAGTGGALHIIMSAFTDIKDSTFTGNISGGAGGAIWAEEDTTMENVTVTGNKSENGAHAVYLATSEYDGQSYFKGLFKMGGDMIIADNEGGDLYLDKYVAVGATSKGYGENTKICVTLDEGLLTQRVYGAYNYEGGDLNYVITYGDRSLTDPEIMETVPQETDPAESTQTTDGQEAEEQDNTILYAGIGGISAVILLAAAILVIVKKKKAGKSAADTNQ